MSPLSIMSRRDAQTLMARRFRPSRTHTASSLAVWGSPKWSKISPRDSMFALVTRGVIPVTSRMTSVSGLVQ